MIEIQLDNISKKFNYEWIFRDLNWNFQSNQQYVILGANGSGKSTLLQIIAGILTPSSGHIQYLLNQKKLPIDQVYSFLAFASPYLELIEEFTLQELIQFHLKFKKFIHNLSTTDFLTLLQLEKSAQKQIKNFSSGMKQRLKLGLAIYSNTPILLLDEPTTNLDKAGKNWYIQNLLCNLENRLCVICSNQQDEYEFLSYHPLDIHHFKSSNKNSK